VRLPDFPFLCGQPDGFATSADIVAYLEAYAQKVMPPIRCGITVTGLRTSGDAEIIAQTSTGAIASHNVVIATGPYQRPVIPRLLSDDCPLFQIHASAYKHPEQLPSGAILVVGSGASGAQIAEELSRAGRQVYLSVGRHKRMPRRYRGRDLIWWLAEMGIDRTAVEKRGPDATLPLITGAYGGHTIDLRAFAAHGITLLGRLRSGNGHALEFSNDLGDSIAYGDAAYTAFLDLVDAYIEREKLSLPEEPVARLRLSDPHCITAPIRKLDTREVGLHSVIWATGYTFDFGWVDLPVLDANGTPAHVHGISPVPGVYFVGLPWLSKMNSSFLSGVGEDAARIAAHIHQRSVAIAATT
jgi:putative flavoprotein involved in K+ transport